MSVEESNGACAPMLAALAATFQNGVIEIRTGPQPASANDAPTGTLIARITRDGGVFTPGSPANGLRFTNDGRYLLKEPTDTWRVKGIATGIAGWYRLLPNALDPGTASLTAPRIDGSIGADGDVGDFQMTLPTTAITAATNIDHTFFIYAIPPI